MADDVTLRGTIGFSYPFFRDHWIVPELKRSISGENHPREHVMETRTTPNASLKALTSWLKSPVTVTLPGWVVAAGASALVILLIAALD
jgi:hypothetical protein